VLVSSDFPNEIKPFTGAPGSSNRTLECPLSLMADSYKGTHLRMYPDNTGEMRVYGTFRQSYDKDKDDHRVVVYGIKYYIHQFVSRFIDGKDIKAGKAFLS
jgi:hypothetical protein